MAYPAGYIELSKERDIPLLKEVLHARFVTHSQLFELMQFADIESCRETFNWRVKRLASHQLLLRHDVPSFGSGDLRHVGFVAIGEPSEQVAGRGGSADRQQEMPHHRHPVTAQNKALNIAEVECARWPRVRVRARRCRSSRG